MATILHAQQPYNVAWHVTYSTYWLPSPVNQLAIPSIWGPVGGAVMTPRALWGLLGFPGLLEEVVDLVAVRLCSCLPATRRTWRGAHVRIVQNVETLKHLPRSMRMTTRMMNHAMFVEPLPRVERRGGTNCVIVGRLESRKGGSLAIRALAHAADDVSLTFLGDGPDRPRLERLAQRLRLEARVHFRGEVPRTQLPDYYATAAAGVFVGLREEGGLALAEAMLAGLPVIVLANGGAHTIASWSTDPTRVASIDPRNVDSAARQIGMAMTKFSRMPPNRASLLDTAVGGSFIRDVLASILTSRSSPAR